MMAKDLIGDVRIQKFSFHVSPLILTKDPRPGPCLHCRLLSRKANMYLFYYAALLPRRGPHIASHSVRPSVCLSVRLSVRPVIISVASRHLANYNETHVLFGMHRGPHIVRPSRPHKLVWT